MGKRWVALLALLGMLIAMPASAEPQDFIRHNITENWGTAVCAYPIDVDGDTDIDIVGSSISAGEIAWWENDGDENFTKHSIANLYWANSVTAADVDGDGDVDVVGVSMAGGDVLWWESDGGSPPSFTQHTLSGGFGGAAEAYVADLNNDGDTHLDVVGVARYADKISWWVNDGNENFTEYTIDSNFDGGMGVYATDVDGDGDVDVLGAAKYANTIAWWENDGGTPPSFIRHNIDTGFLQANSVYAKDINKDSHVDVLGAAVEADSIAWWENDGNENFTKHIIIDDFETAFDVYAEDVDSNGTIDVLGTAYHGNEVAWFDHDGNGNFIRRTIACNFGTPQSVYALDFDRDGTVETPDIDVVNPGAADGVIVWWENLNEPSAEGWIAFTSNEDIHKMRADGSDITRLTTAEGFDRAPSWSPDGEWIAFMAYRHGDPQIYKVRSDGSEETRLTSNNARDLTPEWSPDGEWIAFQSNRDGPVGNYNIYKMRPDGTEQTRLTEEDQEDNAPTWSPDSQWIAFCSHRDGNYELYKMRADGSEVTRLTNNDVRDNYAAWSPDGEWIAYESEGNNNDIWIMTAEGTNHTRLTQNQAEDRAPTWSPDGQWIAFASNRNGGSYEIYRMRADGTEQVRLTCNANAHWWLSWSLGPVDDVIPPEVQITQLSSNGACVAKTYSLVADVSDYVSGVDSAQWCIESETLPCVWEYMSLSGQIGDQERTASASISGLEPDEYTVKVKAKDVAGNWSDPVQEFLKVNTPVEDIQVVRDELQSIVDSHPGTPLADKLEDALAKVETALEELDGPEGEVDRPAGLGAIEGAVGDIEAAVDDGLLDQATGTQLMVDLACAARQLAQDAIDEAIAANGDPEVIAEAQQYLTEGDNYREQEVYKDAVNKYKDALSKAESVS